MGFDMHIGLKLQIDTDTGLPFVWGQNWTRLPYDPESYKVPQQFRRLIWQRGDHWHQYIKNYDSGWEFEATATDFLYNYPNWADVSASMGINNDWAEADHTYFKAALQWFASKDGYYLHWSY
jgi:hypothetical protein